MPWRCAWPPERVSARALSPPTGDVELHEVTTCRTMRSAPADATEVDDADGNLIATIGRDRALGLLDTASGDLQHGIRVGTRYASRGRTCPRRHSH